MVQNNESFIRPEDLLKEIGLRAEQTLVHLGCGAGFYLVPSAKIVGKNGKIIGVDILPDMLAEAEGRAKREGVDKTIQTIRGNLENEKGSTLEDAVADWVLVANVLHQSDPEKIINEAKRIVKPTGSIAIIEWDTIATRLGPPVMQRIVKDRVITI